MVLVFLSVGLASAACISNACVIEPGTGDTLRSGSVSNIEVSIAVDPFAFPVTKYKLYYTCLGPDFQVENVGDGDGICEPGETCKYDNSRWRLITTRSCNPYVGCPSTYPWSNVPYLKQIEVPGDGNNNGFCETGEICTPQRTCAIMVTAFDMAGRRVDSGIGQAFTILPPGAAPAMYIRPLLRATVAGGLAKFEVLGRPPYKVYVPSEHQSYIAVNGSSILEVIGDGIGDDDGVCETKSCSLDPLVFCSTNADCPTVGSLCNVPSAEDCNPVIVPDPTPLTPLVFTVSNTYSCGTSQEVTITVTDSIGATVSALYVIACP
jgi:hypothetical protein